MRDLSKLLALELLKSNFPKNVEIFDWEDFYMPDNKIIRVTVEMLDADPDEHEIFTVMRV